MNASGFQLTPERKQAAQLVAEDCLGDRQIATTVGVHMATLERWKLRPEFQAAVATHRQKMLDEIEREGIANKQYRIDSLNDVHARLRRVMAARSTELADVPGGDTGTLVRSAKLVKAYNVDSEYNSQDEDGETLYSAKRDLLVYEYGVDTALLKELRETAKQAAQETGQWVEKHAPTDADGKTLPLAELMDRYVRANGRQEDPDSQ